ncbi:MAG: hypothetical protein E7589_04240 [Ruminococcaceae bacterium]|nr:hypothetical protein [Oscillospiraceae bacterium]
MGQTRICTFMMRNQKVLSANAATQIFAYVLVAMMSVVMLAGSVCNCFKLGEAEGICKYGYLDEEVSEG